MGILKAIGSILGGPIKDLTETRKATKAARLEMAAQVVRAEAEVKIAKAKAAATIAEKKATADVDWEAAAVAQAATSWKDEYWTIVLSLPLFLAFIPGGPDVVGAGFEVLSDTPPWYQAAVMAAISFAFGLRALNKFTNWRKK